MLDAAWWLTQFTTILVAALGVAVYLLAPRTRSAAAFAGLLVTYGFAILSVNLAEGIYAGALTDYAALGPATNLITALCAIGLAVSATILLTSFPGPMRRDERVALGPLAVMIAIAALIALPNARFIFGPGPLVFRDSVGVVVFWFGVLAMFGTVAGLALRYNRLPAGAEGALPREQVQTMAAGLALPSAFTIGFNLVTPGAPPLVLAGAGAALVLGMSTWLLAANAHADDAHRARNVAWLIGAAALAPMLLRAFGFDPEAGGIFGVVRLLAFGILAYGLLHGHLLGLDIKIRWTISKSTVAAAFVAVFFIASEAAQQFFGDTLGSTYVGIAAAGALVFAMAPLQRVAEQLAAKAVPPADTQPASGLATRAGLAYKAALRAAMRDGTVTRREERHLAEVASALGIDPVQALEWRDEVERELVELSGGV